ncbi:MAG: hypothetical protein H6948_02720 [Zoogloeaceae bacterium]|nr:hypothetical protein [Zoogloeaceae bacterium]
MKHDLSRFHEITLTYPRADPWDDGIVAKSVRLAVAAGFHPVVDDIEESSVFRPLQRT